MNMNLTYDSISPVTNNLCVLEEVDTETGITSYMCMESGWTTSDVMKIGSEAIDMFESNCSQLMKDARIDDHDRGLSWFPTFIQMPTCMLYCAGSSVNNLRWEVAKVVPVSEDEGSLYPMPGRPGEYYSFKLDVDSANQYDKLDFDSALNELYSILEQDFHEYQDQLRDNGV